MRFDKHGQQQIKNVRRLVKHIRRDLNNLRAYQYCCDLNRNRVHRMQEDIEAVSEQFEKKVKEADDIL